MLQRKYRNPVRKLCRQVVYILVTAYFEQKFISDFNVIEMISKSNFRIIETEFLMLIESSIANDEHLKILFIRRSHRYWTQRESIDIDFLTVQDNRFLALVLDFLKSIFKVYDNSWRKDQITSYI